MSKLPIKKISMKPRFLEKILELTSIQEFFNLEQLPEPIDIRKVYWDIDELHKIINDAQKACDLDMLSDTNDKLSSLRNSASNFYIDTEILEKEIIDLKEAYASLLSLLVEMINKEDIDLRNYSANITEEEWKTIKRQTRIGDILDE
jgi:hypothetical protein